MAQLTTDTRFSGLDSAAAQPPSARLEQYSTLEYILLGDLRELLEEKVDRFTRGWLVALLDALLDILPREMQLKESTGYLSEVLSEYPSWHRQVEELANEQRLLILCLQALRDDLEESNSYFRNAERVRQALREWSARMTAYHRHENRLLQTAINLEVGTGD